MFALKRSTKITTTLLMTAGLLIGCDSDDENKVPQNLAPVAVDDVVSTKAHQQVTIDVLANDSDPEGGKLTLVAAGIKQGIGAILVEDGKLQFKSDAQGTAQIQYEVADDAGLSAQGLVKVQVGANEEVLSYVGTQTCLNCHEDKATFLETGHNFKLSRIENGEAPDFPFTSLDGSVEMLHGAENSLGTPNSWEDVSYVIGGYYRTAMFIDKNGYIVSGDGVRVAIPQNGEDFGIEHILPYAPGDGADSHKFDCGRCHTTGWRDYTPDSVLNPFQQDNMDGMNGSFVYTGVQCEACHGAGSKHVQTGSKDDITKVAEGVQTSDMNQDHMGFGLAMTCGECHSKKTNRHYPGFVSEHNQDFPEQEERIGGRTIPYDIGGRVAYDAMLGMDANTGIPTGKKQNMACHTCHNPHISKINDDQPGHETALVKQCTDCHGDKGFSQTLEVHASYDCESCHMPKNKHFFRINLTYPSDSKHNFSEDGKYVQPWNTAKDACSQCHEHYDSQADMIEKMHN